jgi:hypothetical protein
LVSVSLGDPLLSNYKLCERAFAMMVKFMSSTLSPVASDWGRLVGTE